MNDHMLASRNHRFGIYAWAVLTYNILVILWGTVVRATGSGAGCGEHWPLCQGVMIPHATQIVTLIEFAHRATSSVAAVLVLGLVFLGFRRFSSGHSVRRYAASALFFTLTEGLLGAALVLFGHVGSNASMTRVFLLSLHLVNTLLLIASLALSAKSASASAPRQADGTQAPQHDQMHTTKLYVWHVTGLLGVLVVAVTGAIAALGDTLFHATSLIQALDWDFSGSSNALLRLRIIHPAIAVAVGIFLILLALRALSSETSADARRLAKYLLTLTLIQLAFGLINVLLLAPVWIQVLHLLTADLVWIMLVLLSAEKLGCSQHAAAAEDFERTQNSNVEAVPTLGG
jgi:heme A synthase